MCLDDLIVVPPGRRHIEKARRIISSIQGEPSAIISCGLGVWAEGEPLVGRWPDAQYVAFEPLPKYGNAARRSGYPGIIHGYALWSHATRLRLYLKNQRSSAYPEYKQTQPVTRDVFAHPLDEVLPHHMQLWEQGNFLLWMDAEGSEFEILKGSVETLKRTNWIVIELVKRTSRLGWPLEDKPTGLIEAAGFERICRVAPRRRPSGYDALFARPS